MSINIARNDFVVKEEIAADGLDQSPGRSPKLSAKGEAFGHLSYRRGSGAQRSGAAVGLLS
jgi:hypothetical protein